MSVRRLSTALALSAAAVATSLTVGTPAATAQVVCGDGTHYRVTQHYARFNQVDEVSLINRRSGTATLSAQVGQSHTSTRSFSATISASAEAGFWVFAKASASASASHTIETSTTMSQTYAATASVPGHSSRTVKFGFRRYDQYVQQYYLYNTGIASCGLRVTRQGWVTAPYQKTFIVT